MRRNLAEDPMAWLAKAPIAISHGALILATFVPGTVRVVHFSGSHRLVRAAGWDTSSGVRRLASAFGSWWVDEAVEASIHDRMEMYRGWLTDAEIDAQSAARYRAGTALSEDWNDMSEMFELRLPAGEEIIGLAGAAAPQPQRSTMDPTHPRTPMLAGGAEQVFFKKTRDSTSINPLWVTQLR